MKTESVILQTLFVPCSCRCRYCLLSWGGQPEGVPWDRSTRFALQFGRWQRENRPDLSFHFTFGYSMEHPDLRGALRFLRQIGSPQAEFLQCDGLKMRTEKECRELAQVFKEEGVKHLNFTFYGLPEYHDRFAARRGDFSLMMRMMDAARDAGLTISAGIPLTAESAPQTDELIGILRNRAFCRRVSLFVPHEEGRGIHLQAIRFSEDDLKLLSDDAKACLNMQIYRPEREWVTGSFFTEETRRSLILSLRNDNIDRYETMTPGEIIAEIESLDDAYYAAFPLLSELADRYGNPNGNRFYRQRDLFYHYRRIYAREQALSLYDVTDERQSGSRRY